MEQPKSNENLQSADDAMNRLHNLASEHPDPEKDKIAKKLLEQFKTAQEEGNSDEVIRLIGEIDRLYDGTPKESEKTSGKKDEALVEQKQDTKEHDGLKENGTIIVGPLAGTFDPDEFFSDKNKKMFIGGYFKNLVLNPSDIVSEQPPTAIASFTLVKEMSDSEIRAELPKNHVFALGDLWMIADLIKKANGKSGGMLADGKVNLFYVQGSTRILVLSVYRDGSVWTVGVWEFVGSGRWDDPARVFSRNA
jgi:hypothetical protein